MSRRSAPAVEIPASTASLLDRARQAWRILMGPQLDLFADERQAESVYADLVIASTLHELSSVRIAGLEKPYASTSVLWFTPSELAAAIRIALHVDFDTSVALAPYLARKIAPPKDFGTP